MRVKYLYMNILKIATHQVLNLMQGKKKSKHSLCATPNHLGSDYIVQQPSIRFR